MFTQLVLVEVECGDALKSTFNAVREAVEGGFEEVNLLNVRCCQSLVMTRSPRAMTLFD